MFEEKKIMPENYPVRATRFKFLVNILRGLQLFERYSFKQTE